MTATTYIVNKEGDPPPHRRDRKVPSAEYLGRLVSGAKRWGLPKDYVQFLESIETAA